MREFEDKLTKFLEENENEHTSLEGLHVLLNAAVNIYLVKLQDEKTDSIIDMPSIFFLYLLFMTGMIEEGVRHYLSIHQELAFGLPPKGKKK
jgi:hypothetical protein